MKEKHRLALQLERAGRLHAEKRAERAERSLKEHKENCTCEKDDA